MIEVTESPLYRFQTYWDTVSLLERGIIWLFAGITIGALQQQGWTCRTRCSETGVAVIWIGPTTHWAKEIS